jgi:hypothetical protein
MARRTDSSESNDARRQAELDGERRPGSGPGPIATFEEHFMTDTRASRSDNSSAGGGYDPDPVPTGWVGWIAFASSMMILVGCFQGIQGFVAIFDQGFYHTTESGLVVNVDYTAWGWTHLLLGVLLVACGAGVLAGNIVARTVAVIIAGLSIIVNLMFVQAYPIWSIMIVTVDILVIYSLTVHGREVKSSRY